MQKIEKIVKFYNYTERDFVGTWDGTSEVIKPGQGRHMELWRALHYGKHLVNDDLNKHGLSQYCSPKKWEDVPEFFERIKKCVIQDEAVEVHQSSAVEEMANLNLPKEKAPKPLKTASKKAASEKTPEEEFEGLKD